MNVRENEGASTVDTAITRRSIVSQTPSIFSFSKALWNQHDEVYKMILPTAVVRNFATKLDIVREQKWNAWLDELIGYKEVHGHCNVPKTSKEYSRLGIWVYTQRREYKKFMDGDKSSHMTQTRIVKLEEVGFEWSAGLLSWEKRYQQLLDFKTDHGHCNVPKRFKENTQLGNWVGKQRYQYKLFMNGDKASQMTQERIDMLEAINFQWSIAPPSWKERYQELIAYKNNHGDCNVPRRFKESKQLGEWVATQRTQYKKFKDGKPSHMTQERIDMLEEIGFEWIVRGKRGSE